MSTFTTIHNPEQFFKRIEEQHDGKRTELENYLKVIKNNPQRLWAITSLGINKDSAIVDEVISTYVKIINHGLILSGIAKINGEKGNWSVGDLGSRWLDWDSPDGKTTCRVAFYSKKYSEDWEHDKPYALTFDFENYP